MVSQEQLITSQTEIEKLFFLQVENGDQSNVLGNSNLRSCGQFLKENHRAQRGVHGTSAALTVLSNSLEVSHRNTVPKLFSYLEQRSTIERGIQGNSIDPSVLRDDKNIIKIGEELSALSNINTGIVSKDGFVQHLLSLLSNSKKSTDGWGYFTDSNEQAAELLPTIFATKGILSVQATEDDAIRFIGRECNTKIRSGSIDYTTYAIVVLGIYVLSFYDRRNVASLAYKELVMLLFTIIPGSLDESNEVNIEYWHGDKHEYIRIPWQIYLITLGAKHSPSRFSKLVTQERLNEIISLTTSTGFKYNYSGPYISSRTNAIIYECFNHIKNNLGNKLTYEFFHFIDKARVFMGSRGIRFSIVGVVAILFIYSLYKWIYGTSDADKLNNIGTDLITGVLFWLFSFGKKKK